MIHIKYLFVTLSLCSVYHISLYSFNPKKLLDTFWQKEEHERIQKDFSLPDGSTVELHGCEGTITVKPLNQNKIIIEAEKIGTAQELKDTSIVIKAPHAESSHLIITTKGIPDQKVAQINYTLMVPEHTTLIIRSSFKGTVKIKQVDGPLDISLAEGDIEIANATNSVSAKTNKGTIKLKQKKLAEHKSIFVENGQGDIHLSLPRETHANLHARTLAGAITCVHPITFTITATLDKELWERIKKEIDGTLGTSKSPDKLPGAPITLEATKGNIFIEEY